MTNYEKLLEAAKKSINGHHIMMHFNSLDEQQKYNQSFKELKEAIETSEMELANIKSINNLSQQGEQC